MNTPNSISFACNPTTKNKATQRPVWSDFFTLLDFCTEGYFTKFCLIEKIILFRLICLCFHTTLGTTIMRMVRPNLRSKHKQITEKPKWLLQRISCNFPASKNETKFNWNLLLCLFILTPPASSLTYLFWFAFLYFNWSSLLIHFTRQKNKLGKWENFCPKNENWELKVVLTLNQFDEKEKHAKKRVWVHEKFSSTFTL
jgi:hypothetical protein